jgi:hypothetical protein
MKYEHFKINFKGLEFEVKLLDSEAFFPNSLKEDKKAYCEEFKVIVKNKNKEINFKFYNSQMEREISKYLNELGYIKYHNPTFKSYMKRFMWGGYDKVKNRDDLIKQRIINLFYSIINDMAFNYFEDLISFSWFCNNFGYDEDSRTAETIFKNCQDFQSKLLSLDFSKEFLKYLEEHAQQETDKFKEDIIKAVEESKTLN